MKPRQITAVLWKCMKLCLLNSGVSSNGSKCWTRLQVCQLTEWDWKRSYLLMFLSFLESGNRSALEKCATIYDHIVLLDSGASWLLEKSNWDKCIISSLFRNHWTELEQEWCRKENNYPEWWCCWAALQAATILVAMASGKNFWRPKFWWKSPIGDQQIKRESYLKSYQ